MAAPFIKENPMGNEWTPVKFGEGKKGAEDERHFRDKCKDPSFVAMCIRQHRKWRKAEGEYAFDVDPLNYKEQPFCPRALTIVEDEAIRILEGIAAGDYSLTGTERSWLRELLDCEIKNAEGGAQNERLMGIGAPDSEAAGLHVGNEVTCRHYAGFLRKLKEAYAETEADDGV